MENFWELKKSSGPSNRIFIATKLLPTLSGSQHIISSFKSNSIVEKLAGILFSNTWLMKKIGSCASLWRYFKVDDCMVLKETDSLYHDFCFCFCFLLFLILCRPFLTNPRYISNAFSPPFIPCVVFWLLNHFRGLIKRKKSLIRNSRFVASPVGFPLRLD